ncbi:MAG: HAD hydrolase family protein [Caulobacteraceae bacterium]
MGVRLRRLAAARSERALCRPRDPRHRVWPGDRRRLRGRDPSHRQDRPASSDDHSLLAKVAVEAQALLDGHAAIDRSQPYYLDVTHPKANKGDGVRALCAHLGVDIERTVVIGDMFNDTAMFDVAGFSISMGQSPPEVKARARRGHRLQCRGRLRPGDRAPCAGPCGRGGVLTDPVTILVVTGVSGAGKTTVGRSVAPAAGLAVQGGR